MWASEDEDLVAVSADAARDVERKVPGGNVDCGAVLADERAFESQALLEDVEFATGLAGTQNERDVAFPKHLERFRGRVRRVPSPIQQTAVDVRDHDEGQVQVLHPPGHSSR